MKKKFVFALILSSFNLVSLYGHASTHKIDELCIEEHENDEIDNEECEKEAYSEFPEIINTDFVNPFFMEENDNFGIDDLEDDIFAFDNSSFNDIDVDFDDINLEVINRFSTEPDFFDKISFALQYLRIQCNNSWKDIKNHIREHKELYILGTVAVSTILLIAFLKNRRSRI